MSESMNSFIEQIKQSDEYLKYQAAKEAFDKDTEANQLLKDFQELQQTYSIFQQGGFDGADLRPSPAQMAAGSHQFKSGVGPA